MALEMRGECEVCLTPTPPDETAYICTHECTFCPRCTEDRAGICPNCGGELVKRPRKRSERKDAG